MTRLTYHSATFSHASFVDNSGLSAIGSLGSRKRKKYSLVPRLPLELSADETRTGHNELEDPGLPHRRLIFFFFMTRIVFPFPGLTYVKQHTVYQHILTSNPFCYSNLSTIKQNNSFCQQTIRALVASFITVGGIARNISTLNLN